MHAQIELHNSDCLWAMHGIPDASVDLVLCDLPYGTTQNKWDSVIPLDDLWAVYKRICKPNAAVVLTAAQPFTSALVMSNLEDFKYQWVWDKVNHVTGFLNAKKQPLRRHEDVLIFYGQQCIYNPLMGTGKPYVSSCGASRNNTYGNYGKVEKIENDGARYPVSLLGIESHQTQRTKALHPTQKPVALMEYMIKTYTDEGMTVLDNCMGSGTTGVACVNTDRNFIGIERDPGYFKICQQRIADAQFQRALAEAERLTA